jgi:alkyldihydroxyacetonephosphate synthase
LFPTNCRLLDGLEALISAGTRDVAALLVLGFESADHPVGPWLDRAVELCHDHGGSVPDGARLSDTADAKAASASTGDAVGTWRSAFLRAPYGRDALVRCGVISETVETACTWDAFADLHAAVTDAIERALTAICNGGWVTCRFTHIYPDGPAPYFTIVAPGRLGSELTMWEEIKAAASDAILAAGGTITHHHAVGRDHDPWYRRQRPEPVGRALAATKAALDPAGILNPGIIC